MGDVSLHCAVDCGNGGVYCVTHLTQLVVTSPGGATKGGGKVLSHRDASCKWVVCAAGQCVGCMAQQLAVKVPVPEQRRAASALLHIKN
jgi:hypothetical protein